MSPFAEFLRMLLQEGRVALRDRPPPGDATDADVRAILAEAYADYFLGVPGPLPSLDLPTAVAAGWLVHRACWALVSHDQPEAELDKHLVMPAAPASPAEHLSAELVLRFLPQIHRRARALAPDDRLGELLANVLRQWPPAGGISTVRGPP